MARVNGGPERPAREADIADLVARKGQEYEQRHLADLRERHAERLVEIEGGAEVERLEQAAAETREAMEAGAPVIYQAAFRSDGWTGYVDFLEKVDTGSGLSAWGYEPADTKLARSLKPYFVIQLCLYCELIAAVQGTEPEKMHVILGNGERRSLEFEHGRELLAEKLRRHRPALLIFTFKKTAITLLGPFKGHGHRPELEFAGAQVFVMPGPYERADRVAAALEQLPDLLAE